MGFLADLWESFQTHTPSQRLPNYNSRDYPVRDPNRKLTKRMEIGYNQLLAKLGPISSIDEGIKKLDSILTPNHPNHSRNFLTHPYIKKALNFHDSSELAKESVNEWWKVDKSENKSEIPWSSIPVSESVDICGDTSCSTGVNAFDFRCFTCRKRYCNTHKGTGIDCKSCESLS
jgi:hypothetical protein